MGYPTATRIRHGVEPSTSFVARAQSAVNATYTSDGLHMRSIAGVCQVVQARLEDEHQQDDHQDQNEKTTADIHVCSLLLALVARPVAGLCAVYCW